ncbi:MAG: ABC transporter substrate-binding protein [Proteobacteria bacterium]|nr:ABC transporter substrate-binding protein [Pseudomonadota bacterium]
MSFPEIVKLYCVLMLAVLSSTVTAQVPPLIASVSPITAEQAGPRLAKLKQGLREVGLIEGKDFILKSWYADGQPERLLTLTKEALESNPAILLVVTPASIKAAQKMTSTIPILFASVSDPVGNGIVASLARPGGNTTGLSGQSEDLVTKRVEMIHESLPRARRIAVLQADTILHHRMFKTANLAATSFGIGVKPFVASTPTELATAFADIKAYRPDALLIMALPMYYGERERIGKLAQAQRLAVFAPESEFVDAGSLVSYAPSFDEIFRQVGVFIKKILSGTKPADLPVEQPTKFEMVVNIKVAKSLGIVLPKTFILRADRLVE